MPRKLLKRQRRPVARLLLSVLLLAAGCSNGGSLPPGRKELGALATETLKPPNLNDQTATTDDLVIYLDASEPMKGYVLSGGQSVFSQTLRSLREFATTQSTPIKVHLRTVSKEIGLPQPNAALAEASYTQKIYTGSQSNLVGAISVFSQNLYPTSTPTPVTDRSRPSSPGAAIGVKAMNTANPKPAEASAVSQAPPRFHVLVTDGVQYAEQARVNDGCASGADAFCVQQKIRALLDQGWAGVVLGLRSEYCCAFFSENSQKWIRFDTKSLPPDEHRPFYLFVFSPNHNALDDFVISLKANLRKSINPNPPLRELPLTAHYAKGAPGFERDADYKPRDKSRLRCTKLSGKPEEPLFISLQLREESRAVATPFELGLSVRWSEHGKDAGSPQELAQLLDWSLEKVYPRQEQSGRRYPEIELNKVAADEQGRFVIEATAQWPRSAGAVTWRGYRLSGRFKRDAEPGWIGQWSTPRDTTPAAGSRTLDLRSTLLGLWRNPILEKQPIAEIYLRIGPM
jgi:hypothetical protein